VPTAPVAVVLRFGDGNRRGTLRALEAAAKGARSMTESWSSNRLAEARSNGQQRRREGAVLGQGGACVRRVSDDAAEPHPSDDASDKLATLLATPELPDVRDERP
jgi:hypothetical protein